MAQVADRPVVLLVEDEVLIRMYAAEILSDAGFEVLEAGNATQALALLATRRDIGLLFTDINMPGSLDGLALARHVAALHPHVHLIVTSGKLRPSAAEIPDDGIFIPKPYSPEIIARAVSAVM